MTQVTRDSIAMRGAGHVQVTQPAKGHRFTLDSILLADFCRVRPRDRVLEPGAGTGVVSLLLAKKFPRSFFYPVEIQQDLHGLCEQNRLINALDNMSCMRGDIRRLSRSKLPGHVDGIVANPPYVKAGAGKASPLGARKLARQDVPAGIDSWLALGRFLHAGGRYTLIFPAARLAELFALLPACRLEPKRLRLVHPHDDRPAARALVEAVLLGGKGMDVLPPLIVHGPSGSFTGEMADIYGGTTGT